MKQKWERSKEMFSDKVMIGDGQFYPNWRGSLEFFCITYDTYLQTIQII
jgi:hypothetical protein